MSGVLRGFSAAAYLSTALTEKPCAALLIEKIAQLQRETIPIKKEKSFQIYSNLKINLKACLILYGGREFLYQREGPSAMNYYFTAGGCMSERIRDRYEKTSLCTSVHQASDVRVPPNLLV